jgi:hypothetical protein
MRVQTRDAWELIEAGLGIGYKGDVVNDMTASGLGDPRAACPATGPGSAGPMNAWDRFVCDMATVLGFFSALGLAYGLLIGADAATVPCAVSITGAVGVNLLLRWRNTPTGSDPVDTVRGRQ